MTSTVPYAEVIGDPIAHSKSPLIHGFWLKKLGIEGEYRACQVPVQELAGYLETRCGDPAWRGCNLTIPHKVAALELADEVDWSAETVGATNCIVPRGGKLLAFNTDVAGVDAALPHGRSSACIIGAGGGALAALAALGAQRAVDIRVLARDPGKARRSLAALPDPVSFYSFPDASEAMRDVEAIINASPLGMTAQPSMPASVLDALGGAASDAVVFDMVYSPLETSLLKRARELRLQAIDGLIMLVGQAAGAFHHFFGAVPPREHDAELRELLTA